MAETFSASGKSRILPCLLYRVFRRCSDGLFSFLDSVRLWRRNPRPDDANNQRDEQGMEDMPASTGAAIFPTDLQVSVLHERRSARHKKQAHPFKSASTARIRRRIKQKVNQKTMPVAAIKPDSKISPWFPYVPSGRVRIYVEASMPVDIFVSSPDQAQQIISVPTAGQFGPSVLIRNAQSKMDETINLAATWNPSGWNLTIGHPPGHQEVIAVFYSVYPA